MSWLEIFSTEPEKPARTDKTLMIEMINQMHDNIQRLERENEDLGRRLRNMEYMLESTMRDAGEIL